MPTVHRYNCLWPEDDKLGIEIACVRKGGEWEGAGGKKCGAGYITHFKNIFTLLWPKKSQYAPNRWDDLMLKMACDHKIIGMLGPASSGKSNFMARWAIANYICYPDCMSILVSSTTRELLELRVWGEIKKYYKKAKELWPELPGHLLEYKQMITTDGKESEGRDFRNGIIGLACKVGSTFIGLGSYSGIKNQRVLLCADEASFMPNGFYDSMSNLDSNPWFQLIAAGNPKDPTDALGKICEPHSDVGGWDGLDPSEKTKIWKTRIPDGVAIQLVGTDSPNFDFPPPEEGKHEPFPWLIGRKKIEKNIALYGKESMQYQMMCLGMMPKGGSARRVITRQLCIQHHALEDPIWSGQDTRIKVMGLDAAYGSVGGDRCVAGELDFARDKDGRLILAFIGSPIIVPVDGRKKMEPEDQIALFMQAELGKRGIPIANLGFDATGKGTLAMAFARLGMDQAYAIEYGGDPTDRPVRQGETRRCKDAYSKFVTELWYSVRLIIEAGQFRGLPEEVMDEGCMREWRILQNGKVELEKKQDTKDRMGRSPDLFDMLVAGVEVARRRGFAIGAPNPASRRTPNWMLAYQQRMNQLNRNHALVYR